MIETLVVTLLWGIVYLLLRILQSLLKIEKVVSHPLHTIDSSREVDPDTPERIKALFG